MFSRMIYNSRLSILTIVKDKCPRLEPTYNNNYDLNESPHNDQLKDYLLYIQGEPLYNNKPIIITNLPPRHTITGRQSNFKHNKSSI